MHELVETYEFIAGRLNGDPFPPLMARVVWQEERAAKFIPDIKALLNAHWREAGRHHDRVPMDVNWGLYEKLDEKGELMIIAGRDGERLVGYHVFFVTKHPNYQSTKVLTADVYYVEPAYRRNGFFSLTVRLAESLAKARGVAIAIVRSKEPHIDRALEAMGYRFRERVLDKAL